MSAPVPFRSAEAAWLWTAAVLEARHDQTRPSPALGPCRAEDVVKCLDQLYRRRRIELLHVRILRLYGRRGRAPDPRRTHERCDRRLWTEVMDRLEDPLRRASIMERHVMPEPQAAR